MSGLVQGALLGLVRVLVGAHPQWQGCAPVPRQRIYFANHTSHLDTLVILAALPAELRDLTHPAAALDYWGQTPFRRRLATEHLGAVLVDRTPRPGTDPLKALVEVLERGHSLLVFPEGTRGASQDVAAFKPGIFHLARRFPEVELVPVYLENLWRILPKGTLLVVPLICTVRFGAATRLEPGESKPAFLQRAREALLELAAGNAPLAG